MYGWIDAEKLQTGDALVLPNGDYVFVEYTYTEELDLPVTIYNFEVEDFHTYFVGESHVLVHNKNCKNNKGKDYIQARSNKQANEWANEVGYGGAEELKEAYVGNQGSKFNMFTNRASGEIILIGIKTAVEIATQLFRW